MLYYNINKMLIENIQAYACGFISSNGENIIRMAPWKKLVVRIHGEQKTCGSTKFD